MNKQIIVIIFFAVFYAITFFTWFVGFFPSPSDGYESLLTQRPNVVNEVSNGTIQYPNLSYKGSKKQSTSDLELSIQYSDTEPFSTITSDQGKLLLPLWHQYRHSAVSFWPFRLLYRLIGPSASLISWHTLWSTLAIALAVFYVTRKTTLACGAVFLVLLVLNPASYIGYSYFITEPLIPVGFWLILNLNIQNAGQFRGYLTGFLSGCMSIVRINFIWFLLALIPHGVFNFKLSDYIKFSLGVLIGIVPFLIGFSFEGLLQEVNAINSQQKSLVPFLIDLLNLFINRPSFLHYFWSESYKWDLYEHSSLLFPSGILTYVRAGFTVTIIAMALNSGKYKGLVRKFLLSFIIVAFMCLISVRVYSGYPMYLIGLSTAVDAILALSIASLLESHSIWKTRLAVMGLTILLAFSILEFTHLFNNSPPLRHQGLTTQRVVQKLIDLKSYNPVTLGEGDVGKYEFWSREEIQPIHLYREYNKRGVIGVEAYLKIKKSATFVVPQLDEWSNWYWQDGEFIPEEFVKRLEGLKVKITEQDSIRTENNRVWIFSVEAE